MKLLDSTMIKKYQALIERVVARHIHDPDDQQDCVQDVWMQVLDNIGNHDRRKGVLAQWIAVVARNKAVSFRRRRLLETGGVSDDATTEAVDDEAAELAQLQNDETDPVDPSMWIEAEEIIRDTLRGLPDWAVEVARLYFEEGKNIQDIASFLNISEVAVCGYIDEIEDRITSSL